MPWTWAEMLSSYRFWGLILFSVLVYSSSALIDRTLPHVLWVLDFSPRTLYLLAAIRTVGRLFALYPVWFVGRFPPKRVLLSVALLLVGAHTLVFLGFRAFYVLDVITVSVNTFLLGFCSNTIFLFTWIVILGRQTDMKIVVPALCIKLALDGFSDFVFSAGVGVLLYDAWGSDFISLSYSILLIVAILFLLPVDRDFFQSVPPVRLFTASTPIYRAPWLIVLISLIPVVGWLYGLYLVYQFHREIGGLTHSRRLLTPLGAVLLAFFPLFFPIILAEVAEVLNDHYQQNPAYAQRSSGWVLLWGIIFYPIALALLQHSLNSTHPVDDARQLPSIPVQPVGAIKEFIYDQEILDEKAF